MAATTYNITVTKSQFEYIVAHVKNEIAKLDALQDKGYKCEDLDNKFDFYYDLEYALDEEHCI